MYESYAARAKSRYVYDEVLGTLRRAGSLRIIKKNTSIDYQQFRPYQVIFLLKTGSVPETVDHINGDPNDNRWENLRPATKLQQSANTSKVGVRVWPSGVWYFQLQVCGKRYYKSGFSSREAAVKAYDELCIKLQGDHSVQKSRGKKEDI